MKRLPGVIASAVFLIIGSLFQILIAALTGLGALAEGRRPISAANYPTMPPQPTWVPWVTLGMAAICLGLAVWGIATSIGLLRMRRWACHSILIIGGILAVFGVPSVLIMLVLAAAPLPMPAGIDPSHAHAMQSVERILFVVISLFYALVSGIGIWWLVYFNRKTVRAAFAGTSGAFLPSRRPILISILAVLNMIGAPMCILMVFISFPLAMFGFIFHGFAKAVVLIAFAILIAIAGVGLWRLQEWGRRTAIALQCLGILNCLPFLFRPSAMLRYQEEVNQYMGVPQPQLLLSNIQTHVQTASIASGMLVIVGALVVLIYYRSAFDTPPGGISKQPELIG